MKRFLLFLAGALTIMSMSAREPQSVTWNFTDTEFGSKLLGTESTGGVFDTTVVGDQEYVLRLIHPKDGAGSSTSGLYFHNSNASKGDNYLEIYVPGRVKGTLNITYASAKNTNSYNFFVNVAAATDTVPSPLYDTINVVSQKIMHFETTKSVATVLDPINIDLFDKDGVQVLRIFHVSSTGGRFREITWTETEVQADTPSSVENIGKEATAVKIIRNGKLYIMHDNKIFSIDGRQL